jgi:hypothetical protein
MYARVVHVDTLMTKGQYGQQTNSEELAKSHEDIQQQL